MSTALDITPEVSDPDLEQEPPKEAHIVARSDDGNDTDADTLVTMGMIEGVPLTALCGKVFVPTRDASQFPICPRCAEAVKDILDMRGST